MSHKIAVVLASTFTIALAAWSQDPAKNPAVAAKHKLKAAEEVWQMLVKLDEYAVKGGVEEHYLWSRRWMEAAISADPVKTAQARQDHLKRMRGLLETTDGLVAASRVSPLEPVKARYYVAEAEFWVDESGR